MNEESRSKGFLVCVSLLLLVLSGVFVADPPRNANAVPSVNEVGNGNRTVSWDFTNQSDFVTTNVSMSNVIELNGTNGSVVQQTDQDFVSNGTWDATNLSISGGSIVTRGFRNELVRNGSFEGSEPWLYQNSSDSSIVAGRNDGSETGEFIHQRLNSSMKQFDSMDTGLGTSWLCSPAGNPPLPVITPNQDTMIKFEGAASVNLSIDLKRYSNRVTLYRDLMPSQDWSSYNTLGVWLNTEYLGPDLPQVYLNLASNPGPTRWDSNLFTITPGWRQYLFNLSRFTGDPAQIIHLAFNFTGFNNTALIWVDDVWLYHFDRIDQLASISQEFTKWNLTDPSLDSVSLSFMYKVDSAANITSADLTASVNNTLWASSPSLDVSRPLGWTQSPFYNLSGALTGRGIFNLSFVIHTRVDTPFASSLGVEIDNVTLTVPDYHGGIYESGPFDLGCPVILDNLTWAASAHPDTSVMLEVRGGWSNDTADSSWTAWEQHLISPSRILNNSAGRYIQYRVSLGTLNASAMVSFDWVNFTFHRFVDAGNIKTKDYTATFTPPEQFLGWRRFRANFTTPPGTVIDYLISADSGGNWTPIFSGSPLSFVIGPTIQIMAALYTANTTFTPRLFDFNVTYEYLGLLFTIRVNPASWSGTADMQVQFTAHGYDRFGHIVPFGPTWTTNDLNGSVDNATGTYHPADVGSHRVCASFGSVSDCANVTVFHGALSRIRVSPSTVSIQIDSPQNFSAEGEDSDGNDVPLTATRWTTDVGSFEGAGNTWAVLKAKGEPCSGSVTATNGTVSGSASVTVTASTTLRINGIVPDQVVDEDAPPWPLNLTPFLPTSMNRSDLMWYMTGDNSSLFSVFGERTFGQHTLCFSLVKDAFGDNKVTLYLQNKSGGKVWQDMWVRVMPENDAPVFYDVPPISVMHDSYYEFEYDPYVFDVDNPKSNLLLSSNDQTHARVRNLVVNYTYDSSFDGQTVFVRLRISDGQFSSETIQQIRVTDNPSPHVVKPLPEVVMNEDEVAHIAFPEPLANYFRDPDGEQLTFSSGYCEHLKVTFKTNATGTWVNITPNKDWYGVEWLRIRATDPSAFAEQIVRVTVNPVNDPPVLDWRDDVYVKYDVPYNLDLADYVSDVDNPMSDLVLSTNRTDIAPVDEFVIHFFIQGNIYRNVSSFALGISLSDGVAAAWSNIIVRVGDNEPPILLRSLPDISFNEDETAQGAFDLNDYFIDADHAPLPLSYTIQNETVRVTAQAVGGHMDVSFSAPLDWNGQEVVHVIASDGLGIAVGRLTVRVIPVDDAPVIDPIPDQDLGTGGARAIDLRLYIHDVDNNITELLIRTNSPHATVYGYILILDYRSGETSETVTLIVNDTQLESRRTFNVIVNPESRNEPPDLLAQILWPWSLLLLLLIPAIAVALYNRSLDRRYTVEDVFMVGKEGRLIMHNTRHLSADRDEDIIAGMLTAIMDFIKDSFREGDENLKAFEFGNKRVLIERGTYFYLAGMYSGEPPEAAPGSMRDFVLDVEAEFGDILQKWSGDADDIRGLKVFMDAFVAHRSYRRGDWKKYAPKKWRAS